ncbi:MAG: superoxide dismutase family protein [Burkholderiales bacterium]|nr:superoxide dismutase family protein [Burkholderiales bacterium]
MKKLLICLSVIFAATAYAKTVTIPMSLTNESQTNVGNVTATDTKYGVEFTFNLNNLTPAMTDGVHGFHVHENPSCESAGMAAGSHLDPKKTKHHYGPYSDDGHLGDLPAIYINADGTIAAPVVAPKLKVKDILGHSLMIHHGGDNYSDVPAPLGGGGSRMVCGVIPDRAK